MVGRLQVATIVTNPGLGKDVAAMRKSVLAASPHIIFVSAQIGFAQVLPDDAVPPFPMPP